MNRKAFFLDRDGIINEERDYVHRIQDFQFMEDVFEVLAYAQSLGYLLIVITNQAGIARGYYTEADFYVLNEWMIEKFKERGIRIDRVYHCPYHPTHGIGPYKQESAYRKPAPGMILLAAKEFAIDLSQSLLIGDKESDIEAGVRASVGTTILLKNSRYSGNGTKADGIVNRLIEVVSYLRQ